jgi:hypothetical protein
MQVEIISSVHWDGAHRDPGCVIDVKEWDANWLISRKKAKPYDGTAPVINRVVALETSDQPKLTKRTWKKSSQS